MQIAGYSEAELLGEPHNIIRHPDMPRAVFRLLWHTLQQGNEFFGLVKNRACNGDFYWTYANVTPSYDNNNKLLGYYSVRRKPARSSIETISEIYQRMSEQEARHSNSKEAMDASISILLETVKISGKKYNEFIIELEK
jgi:aerotaxis receptor